MIMALSEITRDFSISDSMRAWAEKETPTVNIEKEHLKFVDFFMARRRRMHDWTAAWRNWMRRSPAMHGVQYTAEEIRLKKLTAEFAAEGFRPPHSYENSVIYQVQRDAWDLKRRQVPVRDISFVTSLARGKRL
jgi:hypothetical protein